MKTQVIPIGLSGANGRMGQAVQSLIHKKNSGFKLTQEPWNPQTLKVVIDFSSPSLFSSTLKWCVAHQKPFLSGTTGLSPSQKKALKVAGQKIPVFYEENMSWGIWQIKAWISSLSKTPYKIILTDIHHKNKKDKPSGTALKLKKQFPAFCSKNLTIKSRREGDVFGTHHIVFKGKEEWITLEHRALSRKLFAGGALKVAKWLIHKPIGLYSFEDIYGIKPKQKK